MNSLYVAALGMINQQINIDVISNNLANINTPGFKKSAINFSDIYFQGIKNQNTQEQTEQTIKEQDQNQISKTTVNFDSLIGVGSKANAINRIFTQGIIQESENPLDLAIEGDGFFKVILPDGTLGYTRDGSFHVDASGNIVNSNGFKLQPPISINQGFKEILVSKDGNISIVPLDSDEAVNIGKINLFSFPNPSGLQSLSDNVYIETPASGNPKELNNGFTILQGYKEMSNVNVIEEVVNMINAQRAYEINSKAVKTSDEMMSVRNNLR